LNKSWVQEIPDAFIVDAFEDIPGEYI